MYTYGNPTCIRKSETPHTVQGEEVKMRCRWQSEPRMRGFRRKEGN